MAGTATTRGSGSRDARVRTAFTRGLRSTHRRSCHGAGSLFQAEGSPVALQSHPAVPSPPLWASLLFWRRAPCYEEGNSSLLPPVHPFAASQVVKPVSVSGPHCTNDTRDSVTRLSFTITDSATTVSRHEKARGRECQERPEGQVKNIIMGIVLVCNSSWYSIVTELSNNSHPRPVGTSLCGSGVVAVGFVYDSLILARML